MEELENFIDKFKENKYVQSIRILNLSDKKVIHSVTRSEGYSIAVEDCFRLMQASLVVGNERTLNDVFIENDKSFSFLKMLNDSIFILSEFDTSSQFLGKIKAFHAAVQMIFDKNDYRLAS